MVKYVELYNKLLKSPDLSENQKGFLEEYYGQASIVDNKMQNTFDSDLVLFNADHNLIPDLSPDTILRLTGAENKNSLGFDEYAILARVTREAYRRAFGNPKSPLYRRICDVARLSFNTLHLHIVLCIWSFFMYIALDVIMVIGQPRTINIIRDVIIFTLISIAGFYSAFRLYITIKAYQMKRALLAFKMNK